MTPINDRRDEAWKALDRVMDRPQPGGLVPASAVVVQAINTALEFATRVRLTPNIIEAGEAADSGVSYGTDYSAIITAAFEAAGFEVID